MLENRCWFLTWATYGTWLLGDRRGFVSDVRAADGSRVRLNQPGEVCNFDMPGLREFAKKILKGEPIYLTRDQANVLAGEFRRTADYRRWDLAGFAVMAQHVHVLVVVAGDPDPSTLLAEFKSYGSRSLNRRFGARPSGTWWAESGSKRKVSDQPAFADKLNYVRDQEWPLVVWINPKYVHLLKPAPGSEASEGREAPGPGRTPGL